MYDPLSGYLVLVEYSYGKQNDFCLSYNFGPDPQVEISVSELVKYFSSRWNLKVNYPEAGDVSPHEADRLLLDSSKAKNHLQWRPKWNTQESFERVFRWYDNFIESGAALDSTVNDITAFI